MGQQDTHSVAGETVERALVLGYPVDVVTRASAISFVDRAVQARDRGVTVLAMNPEKIFALQRSDFLAGFFSRAGLLIPDGIGVVIALRLQGCRVERVPGADLMQDICSLAADKGYKIFVLGSSEEVNRESVARLSERLPGLKIVGRRNGFFEEDDRSVVEDINRSGAEILFVAMGSPKQERWLAENLSNLDTVCVAQGIGGTLDTITGRVKRAPILWQRLNLEWFYRLLRQPSRAPRQIKLVGFLALVFWAEAVRRVRGFR
ncbi:WecB/TagA/CpsF family glycosyltransferase [Thauera mechernichensis]